MILFAGEKEHGYFVPEIADKFKESVEFTGFIGNLDELTKKVLDGHYSTLIIDIRSIVLLDYKNIGTFCKNISIANSKIRIVVMAEGYNINSKIIQAAIAAGVRFFMLAANPAKIKAELTDALNGKTNIEEVFADIPSESHRDNEKQNIKENYKTSKTIAVCGSMPRIGTTTQALQIVKYLVLQGFKACYIQMENSGFVETISQFYSEVSTDSELGKVSYQNIDMFWRKEKIADILNCKYDYYVYDFGCMPDNENFSLVQFLEKDIKIIVCGSKCNELPAFQSVLDTISDKDINFIFSFTAKADQKDILELMEDRKKNTYFADYVPDQFSYSPSGNEMFSAILKPDKDEKTTTEKKKFGLFHRKKR